jgi:ABC-2 type transport system permease protein
VRVVRLLAVARKEMTQLRRDPRSLWMAFAIPILLLVLYGYALTLDVNNLTTIVYDQDATAASRHFVERFTKSGYFSIVETAADYRAVERALDDGTAQVAIVIPRNFARDLELGRVVPVQALLDGSDENAATIAMGYLESIVARYSEQLAAARVVRHSPALEGRARVWYNADLQSKNFIIPGLIAVLMMVVGAVLTSLTLAREWERGTMEQLLATPIRIPELILGKLLPYLVIGVADVSVATIGGTWIFGVPFRGSGLLLLGLSLTFLAGAASVGVLISMHTRSQLLASQVAILTTFLPSFLLSGFVYEIANMPPWLQAVTYLMPARYFVTALKGIFLKGLGLSVLWMDAALLVLFATIATVAAMRTFRKRLD